MYRYAIEDLSKWKRKPNRKPLVIEGARQVGKTWLAKEFGAIAYGETVYVNFESNPQMTKLFASDPQAERLILGLEIYAGHKLAPENTLLIFDEAQEAPGVLSSLRVFAESAPQYHIICTSSLVGDALRGAAFFPAESVELMRLYPLSFQEFLAATGRKHLADRLSRRDYSVITAAKSAYIEALGQYCFVGGMPEAVQRFAAAKDFNEAREAQMHILSAYGQELSRRAPHDVVPKIRLVLNAIPQQLAKDNKKFIYGLVRKGMRGSELETAIQWLADNGLVHRISRVCEPEKPLKTKADKAFKLFLLDVGLLGCMMGLRQRVLLDGNAVLTGFNGALTQQYVMQQLAPAELYYYTNARGTGEVELIIETGEDVIPVEVKAEINLQAKSLKTYREKFRPKRAVRVSSADYREEDGLTDMPLYAVENIT